MTWPSGRCIAMISCFLWISNFQISAWHRQLSNRPEGPISIHITSLIWWRKDHMTKKVVFQLASSHGYDHIISGNSLDESKCSHPWCDAPSHDVIIMELFQFIFSDLIWCSCIWCADYGTFLVWVGQFGTIFYIKNF